MANLLVIKKENILFFSSIVILLQSFRSYTIYILFFLMTISLLFYSFLKDNQIFNSNRSTQFFYWLFLIFLLLTSIISFFYLPINDVLTGSVRMWFMPLLVLLFYGLISKEKDFESLIKAYLLIIFLASLSIFLQILYGTISFFGESYLRSGLQRYSSILGSVTIFGQVIGVALFLSIVMPFSKNMKIFLVTIFIFAAATSLSKAAVMNAIVAVIASVIYFRNFRVVIYFSILLTLMYFFITIFNDLTFSKYINAMLFTTFRINVLDSYVPIGTPPVTIDQITSRLFGKFDLWNKTALETIFGIGIKGGAGALGVTGVTSHNQYIDLWQMGGFALSISFILLQISTIINLASLKSSLSKILFYVNGMVILNFIVQNGGLFHPATSFFFWISVIYVIFNKENQKKLL